MTIYCEGACHVSETHRKLFEQNNIGGARYAYSIYYFGNHSLQPDRIVMSELLPGDNNHAEFMGILTAYRKYKYVHSIYSDWYSIGNLILPEGFEWHEQYATASLKKREEKTFINVMAEKTQLENIDVFFLQCLLKKLPKDPNDLHWKRHHELHKLLSSQGYEDRPMFNQIARSKGWKR